MFDTDLGYHSTQPRHLPLLVVVENSSRVGVGRAATVRVLLANSSRLRGGHGPHEGTLAGSRSRALHQPVAHSHEVERRPREQMLQTDLRLPDIATVAQPTPPHP